MNTVIVLVLWFVGGMITYGIVNRMMAKEEGEMDGEITFDDVSVMMSVLMLWPFVLLMWCTVSLCKILIAISIWVTGFLCGLLKKGEDNGKSKTE